MAGATVSEAQHDIAPMRFVETLLSPLQPAAATLLQPSVDLLYLLACRGADDRLRLARLSAQAPPTGALPFRRLRAPSSRAGSLHRSTFADLAYCVISLATLSAILGPAVVSASWISDGVAGFLTSHLGPPPPTHAPEVALNAARTLALFLAYDLGFFVDHWLKHRIPALWELHKAHHWPRCRPRSSTSAFTRSNSLILANDLALFIGAIGGAAQYALGRKAVSFTLFDQNALMLLYIYLTAQLQHTPIWIPFTGVWGRVFMSPAHHQVHHSTIPPI